MNKFLFTIAILMATFSFDLKAGNDYQFAPSTQHPFGKINTEAAEQLKDYEKLIGISHCKSSKRNKVQEWDAEIDMIWKFEYILNGLAVQDTTLKSDGTHSGSIRLYDKENQHWQIHYFSSVVNSKAQNLQMWTGGKKGSDLVYYRENKAPNGMDGFYRLTFKDISDDGFNWAGEWVDFKETMSYPTWKISCKKQK